MLRSLPFLLSVLLFSFPASAQSENSIAIGHTDSVFSKILNENRDLLIYIPESSSDNIRYPVLYLLDGDDLFHAVSGIVSHLGEANGNSVIPDMIVVGIRNTNRTRDLTPTRVPEHSGSGGAETFTAFLEKELIPYIESHYPTVSHRVLVGHSFGGLFVMNTVMHHPALFNSYVALDPSVWWDKMQPLKEIEAGIEKQQFEKSKLFVGLSDQGDTVAAKKDTTNSSIAVRSHLGLLNILKSTNNKSISFKYRFFPGESHGTLPLPGVYDGLKAIFDFYKRPSFTRLGEPGFNADSILSTHYSNVSKEMGYNILPPESLISGLAWLCSMRNMPDKELYYYRMNFDNYPRSFHAHLQLGQYYERTHNKKKAIEYYVSALDLQEHSDLRRHLNELKAR